MKPPLQLMLVEDHPDFRKIIAMALAKEEDIELTGQFGTAEQALRELQTQTSAPDIILLDLNLPAMKGLEALPWIRKYAPRTKVIILTQSNQEEDVLKAIQAGAAGYLLKGVEPRPLAEAIRSVAAGWASLDPMVARLIMDTMSDRPSEGPEGTPLSDRELQTLQLLGEGLSKKEIAVRLNVRAPTVATFIRRIYEKLEVPNAPAAVGKAHRLGLFKKS